MKLIDQITKLQASETILKKTLDAERTRINFLNEQLFQLNQKLYESELNDSLDAPRLSEALHIRIETKNKHAGHEKNNNDLNSKVPFFIVLFIFFKKNHIKASIILL